MTSLNRPARLNRVLLAIIGLVLLAAGAFVVAAHFGRLPRVAKDSALVPSTANPPTWVLYVAAGAAVIIGLLCVRWLLAQLARKPRTRIWRFEQDPDRGRTELAASAAVGPFTNELRGYPGVGAATATLAGPRTAPTLALVITADQDGDLTEIRHRLDTNGLPRLCQALDLETLPVTVEFRFAARSGARVH
jgi:membrane protein YqaA with SNARE-associated domain